MKSQLNILRDKIDNIDHDLLVLLSKRLSLVTQVGKIKSHLGLFIYDPEREEMIVSCRKQEAKSLGISSDLVEDILRRIMRESYNSENKTGFKKLCPDLRPIVIIGGQGRMGQFFLKMLILSGYTVRILDQNDWLNVELILMDVGVIFISVPINLVVEIVNKLPRLPNDCIVVDLSSMKNNSLKAILNIHAGPVLGLHPMFSPENNNMIKQVVIYCEGRYPESYQWLLDQIRLWGASLYCCNITDHDKYMNFIQSLCHFVTFVMGYHLLKENINLKKFLSFSSPIFRLELITIGRLFSQDPRLYADIITSSKDSIILIKRYYKRLEKMLILLEKNDKKEFINQFIIIKNWLGEYTKIFFEDSCKILNQINDMKK